MRKAVSGVFLTALVITGCSSGEEQKAPAAGQAPASAETDKLRAALLPVPTGMKVAYGPEVGAFGTLKSTQQGLEALRQAKAERPECAGAAQLDAAVPAVAKAPAAVIAFAADSGSITQAVVSLPSPAFPKALPEQCTRYTADVAGKKVTYRTKALKMPAKGDQSHAYLTTATGDKDTTAQIGSVMIRRGTMVMSMLVVGRQVKPQGIFELARLADETMAKASA
ncbi:hypothetical protein SAMN05421874_13860 [Nonomuraea maritima]|uniref:PknH-like extracellular domain-containing protein n=1 Tax=Nonomuraea maritima TaxID=683260 RepID=A0A1G9QGV1_9ACTN|nr:hypothetical protein [Nonomuraea maritima]SDM09525.1 hypothetical protein SAMN05421874_13860 [Nonomuraea maritima]